MREWTIRYTCDPEVNCGVSEGEITLRAKNFDDAVDQAEGYFVNKRISLPNITDITSMVLW